MHGEHSWRGSRDGHRIETLVRIIGYVFEKGRIGGVAGCHHEDRISIRRCFRRLARADIAAGAANILNIELLTELIGQSLRDQACREVIGAARSEGNDHSHRSGRV